MNKPCLWRLEHITQPGRPRPRIEDVTLDIPVGITAVLGPSGSGKTSLLNLLVGFERAVSGTIIRSVASQHSGRSEAAGMLSAPLASKPARLPVFWSPADHGLWPHLTVREHLRSVMPEGTARDIEMDRLLKQFDLAPLATAYPATLSMGERDRLSVARAMASGAEVLVLDEPLAHVDAARREMGWQALREFAVGNSIVFATQQPETALRYADWMIILDQGRVLATGTPRELYESPPDKAVAALTGPMTWLPPREAELWTTPPQSGCLRPERLAVVEVPQSPLTIASHRSAGVFDAVDITHAQTGGIVRTFLTTPSRTLFAPGTAVALRIMWLLLIVIGLCGCNLDTETNIPPVSERTWSLPADGTKVPAPRGITAGPHGEIYVLDNIGRVLVMDDKGGLTRSWWMPEYSVGKPERLLVCRDGRLAVADTHYHRVVIFNEQGEVLTMFGRRGSGPGEFEYPVAIAEDDRDNLYVCEYGGNDRVQIFRPDGTYVSTFGSFGTGPGQFQRPSGIVWRDKKLYIVDAFNNRVHVCGETGAAVPLPPGAFSAELHYPYDVSLTEEGTVYVVEYGAGRVTWFSNDGKLLGRTGTTGGGTGQLYTPWGLTVDKNGAVYVADTGNRRVVNWVLKD